MANARIEKGLDFSYSFIQMLFDPVVQKGQFESLICK